jgi:DNA adenine methylase
MSRLVPYLGGKRLLAKTILALLPPHQLYCEPFAGSATIFLEKPPSPAEVLNDLNGEMVNLFRTVQNHPEEFLRCVRWNLRTRADFDRLQHTPALSLTEIQRAARLYYLLRAAYGGKPPNVGSHFAGRIMGSQRPFSIYRIEETIYDIHHRLENVTLECLPYADCLRRYDGPGVLFYLDPPYYGYERDYGRELFSPEDFATLAGLLRGLQGLFLLSLNDLPEVRAIFSGFQFKEVTTTYQIGTRHGRGKRALELLISNYDLPVLQKEAS